MDKLYTQPGYTLHDHSTNFTFNISGFLSQTASPTTTIQSLLKENYAHAVKVAAEKIRGIESGKVVNKTVIVSESENRCVDHYNLRLKNSSVAGKSLDESLKLWNDIVEKVDAITSGKFKNPQNGKAYKNVIFNGIGGSYLGPLLLCVAIKGIYYNDLQQRDGLPKLYFVSNTDAESFDQLFGEKGVLDLSESLLVNMSKSGGTAETKGNMNSFNRLLVDRGIAQNGNIGPYNIAITTKNSNFDKFAQKNQFLHTFYMNEETGGRTSVGSAIGMVPATFAKLDFAEFLRGQSYMDEMTRRFDTLEHQLKNPALITAILLDHYQKRHGRKNLIVLGYSDSLREFAHYLQQLYMESLGKQFLENSGVENPEGQTVFGGVGTGEQHAFMQQVQKGINDCIVKFVHFLKRSSDYSVLDPTDKQELRGEHVEASELTEFTKKGTSYLSMGRQMLGFIKGTENALYKNGKPFLTCTYEKADMFNMGMMIALEERIVSILAAFRGINAYDQPGVQDGKISANDMNKFGDILERKMVSVILQNKGWKGSASVAIKEFEKDLTGAPIWYVDSILSDMYGNWNVEWAYPRLKQVVSDVKREWSEQEGRTEFVYQFISKL
nr:unnamed protein product [Naegleria fowleri]